jgi:rubredoxin/uncharacterized membrane protein
MQYRWKCSVCGYIHEGDEPPEKCPVCGADRSQFVLVEEEKTSLLKDMAANFRLHSVVVHFPCGLIPTCALFLLLSFSLGYADLEKSAFWILLVVVVATPVSLASGLYAWRKHFEGRQASIFFKKIILALSLLVFGLVAILLRHDHPELLSVSDWHRWLYLFCIGGMLFCVMLLGHYGSKLVFQAHTQS